MSHIVTIRTRIRDPDALVAACRRLGLAEPNHGTARLFGADVSGLVVRLPGWTYPVVVDAPAGEVRYDNYNGAWGSQEELDRLLQAYAVEKVRLEARRQGRAVLEQALPDGSVRLTIQLGAGEAGEGHHE